MIINDRKQTNMNPDVLIKNCDLRLSHPVSLVPSKINDEKDVIEFIETSGKRPSINPIFLLIHRAFTGIFLLGKQTISDQYII